MLGSNQPDVEIQTDHVVLQFVLLSGLLFRLFLPLCMTHITNLHTQCVFHTLLHASVLQRTNIMLLMLSSIFPGQRPHGSVLMCHAAALGLAAVDHDLSGVL